MLSAATGSAAPSGGSPTASQLVHKAYDIWKGQKNHGVMVMTVENPKWKRQLTVEGWTDGQNKAMIVVRAPQKDKGTATLRFGPRLWTWLPRAERVMSIPQAMLHDSWMGSDFDYEDIVKAGTITTDYTHRILEKGAADGSTPYTIESLPKPDAPIVWGRIVLKGRLYPDGAFHPEREEYYSDTGQLIRLILLSDYKKIDGRDVPLRLECVPQTREGRRTIVTYNKVQFDLDLPEDFFSLQRLQSGN